MEPKPTFVWHKESETHYWLQPNQSRFKYKTYDIVIYKPYGSKTQPWVVAGDYTSDYMDLIARSDDLAEVMAAGERAWFGYYHEDLEDIG